MSETFVHRLQVCDGCNEPKEIVCSDDYDDDRTGREATGLGFCRDCCDPEWLKKYGPEEEECYHDPQIIKKDDRRGVVHWKCDCGYVGTEDMMNKHMADNGWCSECWGSGTDAYPCLGICHECGGSGIHGMVR